MKTAFCVSLVAVLLAGANGLCGAELGGANPDSAEQLVKYYIGPVKDPLGGPTKTARRARRTRNEGLDSYRVDATAHSLATIVEQAFWPDAALVHAPEWFAEKHYEVSFLTKQRTFAGRAILRDLLIHHFDIRYYEEIRPLQVLVLSTPNGEPSFRPSRGKRCCFERTPPVLRFSDCRVGEITNELGRLLHMRIVDETTAAGRYNFDLYLPQLDRVMAAEAVKAALGAKLTSEIRPSSVIVIDSAKPLKKGVSYQR